MHCALAEAERDRNPRDIRPWQFLVGLTVRDQGYLPALKVLDQAEASTGLHVEWPLRRAGLLLRAGPDMARRELPHLLDKLAHYESKDQNRLLAALADAYQSLGDEAESARLWQKVADRDGYNLQAAFALFESKIQARQLDEAEKLLGNIKRIDGEDGAIANYSEVAWRVAQRTATIRSTACRRARVLRGWQRNGPAGEGAGLGRGCLRPRRP